MVFLSTSSASAISSAVLPLPRIAASTLLARIDIQAGMMTLIDVYCRPEPFAICIGVDSMA